MSDKVYIVFGSTGEYSDRTEWPVAAFRSEASAAERVAALDVWLREQKIHMDDDNRHGFGSLTYGERDKLKTELDPSFSVDYTGTRYYMTAVDLAD